MIKNISDLQIQVNFELPGFWQTSNILEYEKFVFAALLYVVIINYYILLLML